MSAFVLCAVPVAPETERIAVEEPRVLLIVLDGVGFDRARLAELGDAAWVSLPRRTRDLLLAQADSVLTRLAAAHSDAGVDAERLARDALLPVSAEALPADLPFDEATRRLQALRALKAASAGTEVTDQVSEVVREQAARMRYAPAVANTRYLDGLRNAHLSIPTSAAGRWAGFEDLRPEVQGNSDTGHQQILNLRLAAQLPLEITESIADGSLYRNPALAGVVSRAVADGRAINFCFLLSGIGGADGRVHSAWSHLEAFLRLIFEVHGADPRRVHMQAILDGRDAPGTSSLDADGDTGAYLDQLQKLLDAYGARRSLAWVLGRSVSMDRDYREPNIRADYLLMTRGQGRTARGFNGLKRIVRRLHSEGVLDSDIPPIAILHDGQEPTRIAPGDAFVDLNFRADRQRAKIAALSGTRGFLDAESRSRGRSWTFDWLEPDLRLDICTLAEYHPGLSARQGIQAAFPNLPQPDNLLALFPRLLPDARYALVGESVKAAHMGYFLRGRREAPEDPNVEARHIIPSFSERDGVVGDSDVYKRPGMRSEEIAGQLVEVLVSRRYRLVCANLANADMLGHLLPLRLDETVVALGAVDAALARVVPVARDLGYHTIITSDHGNVEEDTPSHSANDVLTTVIAPRGRAGAARRETFQARLFDISWTVGRLLGIEPALHTHMARSGDSGLGGPLVGRPIVEAA